MFLRPSESAAASRRPLRKASIKLRYASAEEGWRNPITGIAGCCARAASGHAARRATEKRDELAPLHCLPPCMPNSAFNSGYQNRKVRQAKLVSGVKGLALHSRKRLSEIESAIFTPASLNGHNDGRRK